MLIPKLLTTLQDYTRARAYVLVENFAHREGHGFLSVQVDDHVVHRSGFTIPPRESKGFLIHDFPGPGRVMAHLEVNDALCQIVGYSESELPALTFQAITHPDDLEADLEFVRQLLAGEIRTYQMEKRYFHKNGQIVWALLTVSLVRSSSGEPSYFISQR